ncbi:MAG: hypothetical protein ACAH83_20275 [Alphaproteobacteria bacterium]
MLHEDFKQVAKMEEHLILLKEHAHELHKELERLQDPAARKNRKWLGFGGMKDEVRREIAAKEEEFETAQKTFDNEMKACEKLRAQIQEDLTRQNVAAALAGTSENFTPMRPLRLKKSAAPEYV